MVERLRTLLRDSIAQADDVRRPVRGLPVRGLDSSTNVALMAELTDRPVRTYSTAPRGHAEYDELGYARLVAERFGTDHHEVLIDEHGHGRVPPGADPPPGRADRATGPAIPQHFVSQARARHRHDRRPGRRGRGRALPRLQGLPDHRRVVVPFQRFVHPALQPLVGSRCAGADAARSGAGSATGRPLRRRDQPAALLGRGALLPRPAEASASGERRRRPRDSYELVEAIWRRRRRELRRRPASSDDLPRAQAAAARAAADAAGPQDDGELGRRAASRSSTTSWWSSRWRCRRDEVPRRLREARCSSRSPRRSCRARSSTARSRASARRWRSGCAGDFGERRAASRCGRSILAEGGLLDYDRVDRLFEAHRAGPGRLEQAPLEPLQRERLARPLDRTNGAAHGYRAFAARSAPAPGRLEPRPRADRGSTAVSLALWNPGVAGTPRRRDSPLVARPARRLADEMERLRLLPLLGTRLVRSTVTCLLPLRGAHGSTLWRSPGDARPCSMWPPNARATPWPNARLLLSCL